MFEAAEIGRKLAKREFEERVPSLRTELVLMQNELREADFPVVLLLMGNDRPGCDDVINLLNYWLDPRFVETNVFLDPTDEELSRPRFWRYWRVLPPAGRIGLYAGAWAFRTIAERLDDEVDEAAYLRNIEHVRRFERALVDDGAVVLKFWLHVPKRELGKRLKQAEKSPDKFWRVRPQDRIIHDEFEPSMRVAETYIRHTSVGALSWHVIESTDERYRDMAVAETLLKTVRSRLTRRDAPESTSSGDDPAASDVGAQPDPHTILDTVDLTKELSKEDYKRQLSEHQAQLGRLARRAHEQGIAAVWAFEGWDAAGKGGGIRRMAHAMNAQMYRIVSVAAPTDEERARHYLWRFWRHLPRDGRVLIFDRSWYGRVLVERVEGFASEVQWRRAYAEINDFEEQLREHSVVLLKFWLHIDQAEQLRRFQAREKIPYKQFKITEDDYRNREKWSDYEAAVSEMIARTSTTYAPWNLIPANDKRYARVELLRIACESFEAALEDAG